MPSRPFETDEKQPGDPQKAVVSLLDVVRHEGRLQWTAEESLPLRTTLGSDPVEVMRNKCKETLGMLKRIRGVRKEH